MQSQVSLSSLQDKNTKIVNYKYFKVYILFQIGNQFLRRETPHILTTLLLTRGRAVLELQAKVHGPENFQLRLRLRQRLSMATQDKREAIPGPLRASTLVLVFTQEGLEHVETLRYTVLQVRIESTGDRLLERSGISYEEMREMVEQNLTVEKVETLLILPVMEYIVEQCWRGLKDI